MRDEIGAVFKIDRLGLALCHPDIKDEGEAKPSGEQGEGGPDQVFVSIGPNSDGQNDEQQEKTEDDGEDGGSVEGDGDEWAVLRADKRDPVGVPGTTLTGVALTCSPR